MATQAIETAPSATSGAYTNPAAPGRRDWKTAWLALRRLLADGNDTVQVFRIMRALNADVSAKNYARLLKTSRGGRIAYRRVELSERFSDRAWLDSLPDGTVGAAYRAFLDRTGYSAKGIADISYTDLGDDARSIEHPHAWYGRRERDVHDIWHILTGYTAEEHLGELCLVGFSYAQTRGLGWAAIGLGGALKSLRVTGGTAVIQAMREGYARGKAAAWLSAEDYEALLAEPLDAARARLNITDPVRYRAAREALAAKGKAAI